MTTLRQAIANVIETRIRDTRTIIVGKIKAVITRPNGERDAMVDAGVGMRQGGVEKSDGIIPGAPILNLQGGGFGMHMPMQPLDECVGLVSDRSLVNWRLTKLPGKAPAFDRQHHDLSDTMVLPFGMTPPTGAPVIVDPDFVIYGALGDVFRVGKVTNAVTITKQGASPTLVATITMNTAGGVVIAVPAGQSVLIGDDTATPLVLFNQLVALLDAVFAAGVATPPSPLAGNNGSLAFTAAQVAYESLKSTIQTIKAKGS